MLWIFERKKVMATLTELTARVEATATALANIKTTLVAQIQSIAGSLVNLQGDILNLKAEIEALRASSLDPAALAGLETAVARVEGSAGALMQPVAELNTVSGQLHTLDESTLPLPEPGPPQ